MINTQILKGNLIRQDYTTAFILNQGDKGVPFKVELIDNGTPYTLLDTDIVCIEWLKPNGSAYLQDGNITYGTDYVEFITPEAVSQFSGSGSFNIIISDENTRKGTIRREYQVVPTSFKPGSVSEDVITDAITELRELNAEISETLKGGSLSDYAKKTDLQSEVNTINSYLEEKASKTDVQAANARIDTFTSLAEGSTTGDAELIDGRTVGNTTYTNIGGAIRAVASGEALKDNGIIYSKRTVKGQIGILNCYYPFNIDLVNKQIVFDSRGMNNIMWANGNYDFDANNISTTINLYSENATGSGWLYFDIVNKNFKFYANTTESGENDLLIGVLWDLTDSKIYIFSVNEYTINGEYNQISDNSARYSKRTRKGEYGFLNCYYPFNIDFENKIITFDSRGKNNVTWANGNYDFSNKITSIQLSTEDGTGWLYFNTETKLFNFVSNPVNSNENDILLGVIWGTLFGKKPYINAVGGFTIDDISNGYTRKWEGKTINCLGDSITQGVNATKPYHQWLRQLNGFETINNYGIGGTCISTGENNDFLSRYSNMEDDADVILVFGGTNDWGHHHVLGDINSTDNTTFYGALKTLCNELISKYTTKAIFFITPLQRNYNYFPADGCVTGQITNNNGDTLNQFVNAIKEVCAIFSIPVLDLYNNCFYPTNASVKTQILTDGLHPNDIGHKIMARKISSFIDMI